MTATAEQDQLRAVVRRFLADHAPDSAVRAVMATEPGYDRTLWTRLAGELGLAGLGIPEPYGGAGSGLVELGVVVEELGRALTCAPFLSSVGLAAGVLLACDERARTDYLPGIAAGRTRVAVAIEGPGVDAEPDGEGWLLSGTATHVLDGHVADLVLVTATTRSGPELFAVPSTGLTARRTPTLDQTRALARLGFDRAPARRIGTGAGAGTGAALRAGVDRAVILLAAEQLGGAAATLDMTVAHARSREQFGRPIGSFQAVKHLCADMLVDVECARSAVHHALADPGPGERALNAALAGATCSEAYVRCAQRAIQVHGGIGFTWEHPVGLHYKRAKGSEVLFGTPGHHREVIAASVGITGREQAS